MGARKLMVVGRTGPAWPRDSEQQALAGVHAARETEDKALGRLERVSPRMAELRVRARIAELQRTLARLEEKNGC
jgi:hypothetical protein